MTELELLREIRNSLLMISLGLPIFLCGIGITLSIILGELRKLNQEKEAKNFPLDSFLYRCTLCLMAVQTEKIVILKLTCNVCGYRWEAKQKPVRCAKCKTPYWDKQRKAVNA